MAGALQKFCCIDAFFNNAGVEGKLGPTRRYDKAEFDKIIAVNLTAIFRSEKQPNVVIVKNPAIAHQTSSRSSGRATRA